MSPAPVEHRVTVRDGLTLHTIVRGEARPQQRSYVLVHGLASNARLWDGVADALAAEGAHVVAVDLRGHGRSDKPDHGYDIDTVADDVALLLRRLELERPVVAGQSWGGNVVVALGHAHSDAVAGIAAVDGGMIDLTEHFVSFEECWAALAPPQSAGTPLATVEAYLRRAHPDWPESGIAGALACFEVAEDGTVRPWLTRERHQLVLAGLYDDRPFERFPVLGVPVLFVPADTGALPWTADKRAAIDEALRLLPDGRAHWFSPADHDVHAQFPTEVAAVLRSFSATLT